MRLKISSRARRFLAFAVLIVLATAKPTIAQETRKTDELQFQCIRLTLNREFFDHMDSSQHTKDAFRLDDIETFFLFKFSAEKRKKLRQNVWSIRPAEKTTISDRTIDQSKLQSIDITWKPIRKSNEIELTLDNAIGSKFKIPNQKKIIIRKNGSVIIRSSASPKDGKSVFYWIIHRSNLSE